MNNQANDLDTDTLEEVFRRHVHDGEKDAALTVASMVFGSLRGTPRDWLEENYPTGFGNKIRVVKELRAEFDLALKEAKAEVDEFEEEIGTNFVETDNIMDDAFIGMSVIVNGEEDEVVDLDPEVPFLKIATEEHGWITPHNHTWKVPSEVR